MRIVTQKKRHQWQEAIDPFLIEADLSPSTRRVYTGCLRRFFADTGLAIEQVGKLHLLKFLQRYRNPRTYNVSAAALTAFFAWAADFYGLPNPAADLRLRQVSDQPTPRIIQPDEYARIVAAKGKARDTALLLANTGLRVSELCTLDQIDLVGRQIRVLGKGGKPRVVPLNAVACDLLRKPMQLPKSPDTVRNNLAALARRLGVPKFGPHALRHYFATQLVQRSVNIADVSRLLGHKDINTTIAYYYHPVNLAAAVALLEPP